MAEIAFTQPAVVRGQFLYYHWLSEEAISSGQAAESPWIDVHGYALDRIFVVTTTGSGIIDVKVEESCDFLASLADSDAGELLAEGHDAASWLGLDGIGSGRNFSVVFNRANALDGTGRPVPVDRMRLALTEVNTNTLAAVDLVLRLIKL